MTSWAGMGYAFRRQDCAVCGGRERELVGRRAPRAVELPAELVATVWRCRDCGLVYPDPFPVPDAEQSRGNYRDPDSYFPAAVTEERVASLGGLVRGLESFVGGPGRLLDAGCGRGELLEAARRRGWKVLGADASEEFARRARGRFSVEVRTGDLRELELPPGSFDAAVFKASLEHMADPRGTLRAAVGALRPGGVLFIQTVNMDALMLGLGDAFCRWSGSGLTIRLSPTFPSYQLWGFSRRSLGRLAADLGLASLRWEAAGAGRVPGPPPRSRPESLLRSLARLAALAGAISGRGDVLRAWFRK